MRDENDYSLLRHNTFGIDVRCRRFLEFATLEEAGQVAAILREGGGRFLIVGAGSNLLLTGDYEGTVVRSAIRGITTLHSPEGISLVCGSGETWDDVVAWTVGQGFADLANLSLIPGDVGASAVQNIGAYGAEACQFISKVRAVEIATGCVVDIPAGECRYGYRDSRFKHEWKNKYLVTHVVYRLDDDYRPHLDYGNIRSELERRNVGCPTPQQLRQVVVDIRRAKLPEPQVMGNAGSFFMNPVIARDRFETLAARYPEMPHYYVSEELEKIPAGWLIDQCGWKGRSMGRAAVYDKQALVLVNLGGATGQDIVGLYRAIQEDVAGKFGIELKPEVNVV